MILKSKQGVKNEKLRKTDVNVFYHYFERSTHLVHNDSQCKLVRFALLNNVTKFA